MSGEADINPVDYVEQLKSRSVLFLHGDQDMDVALQRSETLYTHIQSGTGKYVLHVFKGRGHELCLGLKEIIQPIVSFLSYSMCKKYPFFNTP